MIRILLCNRAVIFENSIIARASLLTLAGETMGGYNKASVTTWRALGSRLQQGNLYQIERDMTMRKRMPGISFDKLLSKIFGILEPIESHFFRIQVKNQ